MQKVGTGSLPHGGSCVLPAPGLHSLHGQGATRMI
jgi:hypothetical protein